MTVDSLTKICDSDSGKEAYGTPVGARRRRALVGGFKTTAVQHCDVHPGGMDSPSGFTARQIPVLAPLGAPRA